MANDYYNEDHDPARSGTRRSWSREEKLALIEEAARSTVWGTALKHGITPNILYGWRKQFRNVHHEEITTSAADPLDEGLQPLIEMAQLELDLLRSLKNDVQAGRGNNYNQSCALSNLASTHVKLVNLRDQIIKQSKLTMQSEIPRLSAEEEAQKREQQLAAERELVSYVRNVVLPAQGYTGP